MKKQFTLLLSSRSHFWYQVGGKKFLKHLECLFSVWYDTKVSSKNYLQVGNMSVLTKDDDDNKGILQERHMTL